MLDSSEFIDELNALRGLTSEQMRSVLQDRQQPIERRLAALLIELTASDHSLRSLALELVLDLTCPESEREPIDDPLDTSFGKGIRELLLHDRQDLKAISQDKERPAFRITLANLILMADSESPSFNRDLDIMLRHQTGRDTKWWLDWIRQHRR